MRRLLPAALWLLGIFVCAPFVRPLVTWARERGLLEVVVSLALALSTLAALGLVVRLRRRLPLLRLLLVAAGVALLFLSCFFLPRIEERLHVLLYAVLGVLVAHGGRGRWHWTVSAVIAALCGWAEEGAQGLWPSRVYDWGDVWLNAVSAIAGAALAALSFDSRVMDE